MKGPTSLHDQCHRVRTFRAFRKNFKARCRNSKRRSSDRWNRGGAGCSDGRPGGLYTLKPTGASGPEGGRVWHCPCRFCTSTSTAHDPPPSALDAGLDPENHAFSKLVTFPDSFPSVPNYLVNMLQTCTEEELVDLFSRFMHLPLSEPVVRRILDVYIPMKAQCHQEATGR